MTETAYSWPLRSEFVNRTADLERLEQWWDDPTRDALCMFGRRRVGKSWLFRAFADGKQALILVADRLLEGAQMQRFAGALEPRLGVRPRVDNVAELIRVAYRLGRDQRVLVVIDEFPLLLPEGAARNVALSSIQAVMEEERERSQTKLLLCGSLIAQMQSLLDQSSPLHGRLHPLAIRPMTFAEASQLMDPADTADERITRFAVAGGMARYLVELGHDPLRAAICRSALDRRGSLFSDPRSVLEQELRAPSTYFSVLEALAEREGGIDYLKERVGSSASALSPYLRTLGDMDLVSARLPIGSTSDRGRTFRIDDGFIRFWFRFVFRHQDALEEGLRPEDLWDGEISECLPDFVSPTFETLCARYVRAMYGREAPTVGSWWGNALDRERHAKRRLTEEIDLVAVQRKRLRLVGECKWSKRPMRRAVLDDLVSFKIPAIEQHSNLAAPSGGPRIVLFSRSGFEESLVAAANASDRIRLVTPAEVVAALAARG